MIRSHVKVAICALVVGILIGVNATVALAATAYSIWGYYGPYLDYYYKNQAMVTDDSRLYARTEVANQYSYNVPTGYMGALATLYFDSGDVCATTDWYYNPVEASSMSVPTLGEGCGSGIYYSKGVTRAYNGDGYDAYYTFQSPNINH